MGKPGSGIEDHFLKLKNNKINYSLIIINYYHFTPYYIYMLIAGLCARGTEPHTHGIWSTSFRLVESRVRTYIGARLQIVRVG